LELDGKHQLLIFAADNFLGESTYIMKKDAVSLLDASKEVCQDVNTKNKMYVYVSSPECTSKS
jgi:hypothetical protein